MDMIRTDCISFFKDNLPDEEIELQTLLFNEENLFPGLLDVGPYYLAVLNQHGQIIYANGAFKNFLKSNYGESFLGKRTGDVLKCLHAQLTDSTCGLSDSCLVCGASRAIVSSLKGSEDVQECRIIQKDSNNALDLRVWTKPMVVNKLSLVAFVFTDISNEKRRTALERIFFHDIINTASSLNSFVDIVKDASHEELKKMIPVGITLINRLFEEITSQRDLMLAENNELEVEFGSCNSLIIINELKLLLENQNLYNGKRIELESGFCSVDFISDEALISRVLNNMIKNALEAAGNEDVIKLDCKSAYNKKILFSVHNPGYIPKEVQYQIFQRSYSTKGKGRGLGAYSMKLLSTRYLKGNVYFQSDKSKGTTFYAEYPLNPDMH